MKVKLIYPPEEAAEAGADLALLQLRHPGSKVRTGTDRPDQRQVYLKTAGASRRLTPCDLCGLAPPGRDKPCSVCPAEAVAVSPES